MSAALELGILELMKIGRLNITITLSDLALVAIAVVIVLDYVTNGRLS